MTTGRVGNYRKRSRNRQTPQGSSENLRKDITSLENNLTWINTAGMASVVVLVGIVIAIIKRKRTAAK